MSIHRLFVVCLFVTALAVCPGNSKGDLLLSEVFYDQPSASDDGHEWVELFNSGPTLIDLSGFSIGYGGSDYTYGMYQLQGTIGSGDYFVVGGPSSNNDNGNPVFDQAVDFNPDIQNSGATADGVALFNITANLITETTIPIDVVIYGETNSSGLIDETGLVGAVDVGDAGNGDSITFNGTAWTITSNLTPGTGSLVAVPEPSAVLIAAVCGVPALVRRRRN